MITFELNRDYPLTTILGKSGGNWIVSELIKGLSPSEAVLLLRQSAKGAFGYEFPSSQVCLVSFRLVNISSNETERIYQSLSEITTLWVMVVHEELATPIRVISEPLSFAFDQHGQSSLTISMRPQLSLDEWRRLGMNHIAVVTINESEGRRICSVQDVENLCYYLKELPSFFVHASRFDGSILDVGADANGAVVDYLDIKGGVKLTSLNRASMRRDIVRQRIDALPYMELETERRHLIPIDKALNILCSFLNNGALLDMAPWPVDD